MLSSTWESRAPIPLERTLISTGYSSGFLTGPENATSGIAAAAPRNLTSRDLYQEICRRLNRKGYAWE